MPRGPRDAAALHRVPVFRRFRSHRYPGDRHVWSLAPQRASPL